MTNCRDDIMSHVIFIRANLMFCHVDLSLLPNDILSSVYNQKDFIAEINETLYSQIRKNTDD